MCRLNTVWLWFNASVYNAYVMHVFFIYNHTCTLGEFLIVRLQFYKKLLPCKTQPDVLLCHKLNQ